jgi:hypothetical protein
MLGRNASTPHFLIGHSYLGCLSLSYGNPQAALVLKLSIETSIFAQLLPEANTLNG